MPLCGCWNNFCTRKKTRCKTKEIKCCLPNKLCDDVPENSKNLINCEKDFTNVIGDQIGSSENSPVVQVNIHSNTIGK